MSLLLLCLSSCLPAILGRSATAFAHPPGFAESVEHCESCCDASAGLTAEEFDAIACKTVAEKLQSVTRAMESAMCTGDHLVFLSQDK